MISAREIVSRSRTAKVPKQTLCSARRILKLVVSVVDKLLAEKAPYRVFRWVAWAPDKVADQHRRADLVLHLHRTFERRADRWFDDVQHKAALEVWLRARAEALKAGRPPPRAAEVPDELYEDAILALPKRRRAPKPAAPVAGEEEVLRMLRELQELLVQQAAAGTRKPPVFKLRASQERADVQAATARAQAEAERAARLREEAERRRLGQQIAALLAAKARVEAENTQLRVERARDDGVPWGEILLALAAAATVGVGVAAFRTPEPSKGGG